MPIDALIDRRMMETMASSPSSPEHSAVSSTNVEAWRENIRRDVAWRYNFEMGRALRRTGDSAGIAAAIDTFKRALTIDPSQEAVHFSLVTALRDAGRTDEAEACHRQAAALHPGYEAQGRILSFCEQAVACCKQKRHQEATTLLDQAVALHPKGLAREEVVQSLSVVAQALLDTSAEAAVAVLETAASVDPTDVTIPLRIGQICNTLPDGTEKAIDAFSRALRIDPENFDARALRAINRYYLCRFDDAKEDLLVALAVNASSIWAIDILAQVLLSEHDFDEAEAVASRALAVDTTALEPLATLVLAQICGNRLEAAEAALARGLEQRNSPLYPFFINLKGLLFQRRGRAADAVPLHQHALDLAPTANNIRIDLALALQAAGRTEEALAIHRQIMDMKYRWMALVVCQRPWAAEELRRVYGLR